jgi:hypothetical protein
MLEMCKGKRGRCGVKGGGISGLIAVSTLTSGLFMIKVY